MLLVIIQDLLTSTKGATTTRHNITHITRSPGACDPHSPRPVRKSYAVQSGPTHSFPPFKSLSCPQLVKEPWSDRRSSSAESPASLLEALECGTSPTTQPLTISDSLRTIQGKAKLCKQPASANPTPRDIPSSTPHLAATRLTPSVCEPHPDAQPCTWKCRTQLWRRCCTDCPMSGSPSPAVAPTPTHTCSLPSPPPLHLLGVVDTKLKCVCSLTELWSSSLRAGRPGHSCVE